MAKRRTRRRGGLARLSVVDLQAELSRRLSRLPALERRERDLAAELDRVRADIAALGGTANGVAPARGRRRRKLPRNKMTLVEALAAALKGKKLSVGDAMEAVRKAGYRTNAKNFRAVVSVALVTSGKFKRVGRGEYRAK